MALSTYHSTRLPTPLRRPRRLLGNVAGPLGLLALFALSGLLAVTGCRPAPEQYAQPRLVILYASCTVNRLYTAAYDPSVGYTPNIGRFAERATVFDRHHTESGQSGLAFASLFSGSQGRVHGVFKHPRKLQPELVLVPEIFAAAGYDTHSWLVQKMASSRLNYAQGVPEKQQYQDGPLEAFRPQFQAILERLRTEPDYRAFIVTNFSVTHGPYEGALLDEFCAEYPSRCEVRGDDAELARFKTLNREQLRPLSLNYEVAVKELGLTDHDQTRLREINDLLYKADMYRLDKMFGGVVDAVDAAGLFDDSVVAFTSDHGEVMWRDNAHLRWTHGYQLAPEVINVALLMSGPSAGIARGRYGGVSRSIDVMPTLAGLAGLELPEEYEGRGRDLAPALRGNAAPPDLTAYSHSALLYAPLRAKRMQTLASLFPSPDPEFMWVAARRGDLYFKLRRRPDDTWYHSVFDLAADPEERNDLVDPNDPFQREMFKRLEEYKVEMSDAAYNSQAGGLPRAKAVEMLRSMGYID